MYSSIEDFVLDFSEESKSTVKVFNALSNESLNQKVWDEGRTLRKIAWHIVQSLAEMMNKTGLSVKAPREDSPVPDDSKIVSTEYENAAESLISEVQSKWTDEMLQEEIELYGMKWARKNVLYGLLKHEIHHRAQLTVLMRQAGLKVPGLYGPAKEEWEQYGMPRQD